jgi:hypothetical protein
MKRNPPALILFEGLIKDESFIGEKTSKEGLTITITSNCDDLVFLKRFGAGNVELMVYDWRK